VGQNKCYSLTGICVLKPFFDIIKIKKVLFYFKKTSHKYAVASIHKNEIIYKSKNSTIIYPKIPFVLDKIHCPGLIIFN
jgi:hypothetical protein